MYFSQLAVYIEKIETTSSRLEITRLLAEIFRRLNIKEIGKTVYLLQGRVVPLFEKTEFGMAEKMVVKATLLALNLERKSFETRNKQIGDLGKTVEEFKSQFPSLEKKDFSILEVYNALLRLATASGEGSQDLKINILADLIRRIDSLSSRYLIRIPLGVMRLGFSDMTVLDSLSWMLKQDKSLRPIIEKAYHVRPDLGFIAQITKQKGVKGLKTIVPEIYTPILMMRAERLSSGKEIIEKIGRCAVQSKYDGFRLQIHYRKSKISTRGKLTSGRKNQNEENVKLFSRSLEDVTYMYPDIVEAVKKEVKATEAIFEGEAIGFNPQTGEFLPFQETVQRKRKYNIAEKTKEIPLKLFAFELLYLNGINYLQTIYAKRREMLRKVIKISGDSAKNTILVAEEEVVPNEKKIELLFNDAISKGLEGIIAKKLDGIYQPGARGWNWIKFKRSYASKINDTIDCLVLGYDLGRGKRTSFGMGAFLVGVYDEKEDKFVTVAKIGTGLTDEEWKKLKVQSSKFKVQKQPSQYSVDKGMECDVWLMPKIVVEIKADEITRSPVHTAGRRLRPTKTRSALEVDIPGFALRFPRLQKFRDDKRSDDVTTLIEVEKMYAKQGS
ncbi:DNA ligase [Candidatus Roizmanbacteria bacterium CG02_land_8_20_14_3_00_36_15]|uniref:Probable DNA ligase n=2 Tax=Candidatus Roizmaniibacteriota TaxID=1752723 RepID=A0A2M8KLG3_9BACT|nr:MAG: DNA ligase [Candidatus Roizmanbacteria bacterium CG03_land_8_20_14_0_80_36_21]PIV37707.1 MAG: DNA ligase [Candidatus Roizmanbacteria bacterium CG02_land_8_20_14_3_00_36_15]PIY69664.1 MAG: DNA ligase [Candidatus Roizmanbacteria bacterium CG_4_10_14_0_8_um_filter_36_36]PJA53537.1 MAG: DNA ligase [Candidatus Roizmanbacteria bacterium CG_4_9_14_3_um_filter_36_11]PJC81815.1 MAG: DNA ligase [Candidatus Roizmanbacteria bacterium CG_4_8_14_3_um_filter_36_10]PJE60763.1 MAG: DNA ligase [Candidat